MDVKTFKIFITECGTVLNPVLFLQGRDRMTVCGFVDKNIGVLSLSLLNAATTTNYDSQDSHLGVYKY